MGNAKTICFANQKGGVAKTTTCIVTASALTSLGYSVLVVDMDSQANATRGMGIEPDPTEGATDIYDLMKAYVNHEDIPIDDAIVHTTRGDLVRGSFRLFAAETEFTSLVGREHMLRKVLAPIKDRFDFILIDTAPNLGWGVLNALTAADHLIIPCTPALWANEGILKLLNTLAMVQEYLNQDLDILGILITISDPRTVAAQNSIELSKMIGENASVPLFDVEIPRSTTVCSSANGCTDLLENYPLSKPSIAYREFANELIKKVA